MTPTRKSKLSELLKYDKKALKKTPILIGTDEAGRGPVAGPVVASAVCFKSINKDLKKALIYLDDSKKFSSNSKLRKELFDEIKKYSYFSIKECTVEEIEEHNILQASLIAMKRASEDVLMQVSKVQEPGFSTKILVDGRFTMKNLNHSYTIEQEGVIKGDSKSASIAAASILAKVSRDEFMIKLAEEYPAYDWHKNKGYPTAAHLEAIRQHGTTKWHRMSFLTKCLDK